MRKTDTLENVIGKVHEMSAKNFDEIIPIRDIRFENLDRVEVADLSFDVLHDFRLFLKINNLNANLA